MCCVIKLVASCSTSATRRRTMAFNREGSHQPFWTAQRGPPDFPRWKLPLGRCVWRHAVTQSAGLTLRYVLTFKQTQCDSTVNVCQCLLCRTIRKRQCKCYCNFIKFFYLKMSWPSQMTLGKKHSDTPCFASAVAIGIFAHNYRPQLNEMFFWPCFVHMAENFAEDEKKCLVELSFDKTLVSQF